MPIGNLPGWRNGTPCIIPKTAGVAEVLRHAMRVDYWDVDDMADKVIGLLEYPQLWEELSGGGLDEVRDARLGLDEAARRTGEAYAVALGSPLA